MAGWLSCPYSSPLLPGSRGVPPLCWINYLCGYLMKWVAGVKTSLVFFCRFLKSSSLIFLVPHRTVLLPEVRGGINIKVQYWGRDNKADGEMFVMMPPQNKKWEQEIRTIPGRRKNPKPTKSNHTILFPTFVVASYRSGIPKNLSAQWWHFK